MLAIINTSLLCERDRGMKDVMFLGLWLSIPPERCHIAMARLLGHVLVSATARCPCTARILAPPPATDSGLR